MSWRWLAVTASAFASGSDGAAQTSAAAYPLRAAREARAEAALSKVPLALDQLRLRYRQSFRAIGDRAKLMKRWRVGPGFFVDRLVEVFIDGHRFRAIKAADDDSGSKREVVWDGANLQLASGPDRCTIFDRAALACQFGNLTEFFEFEYLAECGVLFDSSVSALDSLPSSAVLAAIYEGAKCEVDPCRDGTLWIVEQASPAESKRIWIDPSADCAVVASSSFRDGSLICRSDHTDFERIGGWTLPRKIKRLWYSWHTSPGDVAREPLMEESFDVLALSDRVGAKDLNFTPRRPGSLIYDTRFAAMDTAHDGFFGYTVPFKPERLAEEFDRCVRVRSRSSWGRWLVAHLVVLSIWIAYLIRRS